MDNLKNLTHKHHMDAERQVFVKELLSGTILKKRYAMYLYNQHVMYSRLELLANLNGLLVDLSGISRATNILADYYELHGLVRDAPEVLPSTTKYLKHLSTISNDPAKLMAHVYVRHMGDLYGGQMIAKRVPGAGKYYEFDTDMQTLKDNMRKKLDDSMADEAKLCFEFATLLFKEMSEYE